MKKTKIIIHHSASSPSTTWEQINEWHRQRGFTKSILGWYIGYHYVCFPDGKIRQARTIEETGCHCVPNEDKVGICLIGDFTKAEPTKEQYATLENRIGYLLEELQVSSDAVYGHREFKATECPGNPVMEWIKMYRQIGWLKERIRQIQAMLANRRETYKN